MKDEEESEEEATDVKKSKGLGETDAFVKFKSCAIDEIKMKVFGEPEKYRETSVFIASRE